MMLWNLHCQPGGVADPAEAAELIRPENRPAALARVDLAAMVGEPSACRQRLVHLVDGQIAAVRAREERLREGRDAVERSRVVDPNLFVQDEKEARLFFRYFGESKSTFLRCFKELKATCESDARAEVRR